MSKKMKKIIVNKLGMIDYTIQDEPKEEKIINVLEKQHGVAFGVHYEKLIPICKHQTTKTEIK